MNHSNSDRENKYSGSGGLSCAYLILTDVIVNELATRSKMD